MFFFLSWVFHEIFVLVEWYVVLVVVVVVVVVVGGGRVLRSLFTQLHLDPSTKNPWNQPWIQFEAVGMAQLHFEKVTF